MAFLLRILTEPRGIDWESTVGQALGKVSTESVQRGREGPRHCHTLARLQGTSTKGLSISCLVLTHPASQGRGIRAPLFSQPPSSLSHRTSSTSVAYQPSISPWLSAPVPEAPPVHSQQLGLLASISGLGAIYLPRKPLSPAHCPWSYRRPLGPPPHSGKVLGEPSFPAGITRIVVLPWLVCRHESLSGGFHRIPGLSSCPRPRSRS